MEKGKAEEPGVEITDFHLVIYFTEMKMRTELQKWWKLAQLQWKIAHACLPIFCISECIKYNAIIEQIQSQQEGETRWRNECQTGSKMFPTWTPFSPSILIIIIIDKIIIIVIFAIVIIRFSDFAFTDRGSQTPLPYVRDAEVLIDHVMIC